MFKLAVIAETDLTCRVLSVLEEKQGSIALTDLFFLLQGEGWRQALMSLDRFAWCLWSLGFSVLYPEGGYEKGQVSID